MAGAITTLGIGSTLPLADMLDDLREIDEQVLDIKGAEKEKYEAQVEEFTVVKNKLLAFKSCALDLSLESTFLTRTSSCSDEKVATVSANDGAEVQALTLDVESLASKSSWKTTSGFGEESDIIYIPNGRQTSETAASTSAAFVPADGTLLIEYGSEEASLSLKVSEGDSIAQLVNTINGAGLPLTAYAVDDGEGNYSFYVRHANEGYGEDYRVNIKSGETGLSFAAPEAEFSYQIGDETKTIKVAGDTTLREMADLVNGETDNLGVTAKIINSGVGDSPYQFVLQADETGEDNRIVMSSQLLGLIMQEDQGYDHDAGEQVSLNAQFTLDGINYQRQSNSVDDILAGVTIDLVDTGNASVSVANDDESTIELIAGLVDAYNEAVTEIDAETAYDAEDGEFGMLFGTTVGSLTFDLKNLMTSLVKADVEGNVTSMFDLGMEVNRDGSIDLDQSALSDVLNSNRDDVTTFFLGDDDRSITGFADLLNDRLRSLTSALGPMDVEKTTAQEKIYDLELTLESETARLDKKYELLTQQFVQLDQYMNQMTSMSNYLTGQFDSLKNVWDSTK